MSLADRAIISTLIKKVLLVLLFLPALFNTRILLHWSQVVLAVSSLLVYLAFGIVSNVGGKVGEGPLFIRLLLARERGGQVPVDQTCHFPDRLSLRVAR